MQHFNYVKRTSDTVHEFTGSIADDPHSIYFRKENAWVTQRISDIDGVKYRVVAISLNRTTWPGLELASTTYAYHIFPITRINTLKPHLIFRGNVEYPVCMRINCIPIYSIYAWQSLKIGSDFNQECRIIKSAELFKEIQQLMENQNAIISTCTKRVHPPPHKFWLGSSS